MMNMKKYIKLMKIKKTLKNNLYLVIQWNLLLIRKSRILMLVIVIGTYAYFSDWKEPTQKTIITNNNGEVIASLSDENNNLGH